MGVKREVKRGVKRGSEKRKTEFVDLHGFCKETA